MSTCKLSAIQIQILDIFAANHYEMNLQEILAPLEALFMFSFEILKAGGDLVNNALIIIIAIALVYWTVKLVGFQGEEVPNR